MRTIDRPDEGVDEYASGAGDGHEGGALRRGERTRVASPAVLVAFVLVAGAGCWQLWDQHRDEANDAAVLEVARQVAADLVTVGSQDPAGDVERILDGTTGQLRQQFADVADAFTTTLGQGDVSATGEVSSIGLTDVSDDRATVIAAVVATVSNSEVPQGQRRAYRMLLTVENVGGRWAVSNMEVLQ